MFRPDLPAINNFLPNEGIASTSRTEHANLLRTKAAIKPAGPPPIIKISGFKFIIP